MDPKQVSEVDQALKLFSSTTPGFLWTFFSNCKEEGFTEAQAMALTMKELELLMSSRGQS